MQQRRSEPLRFFKLMCFAGHPSEGVRASQCGDADHAGFSVMGSMTVESTSELGDGVVHMEFSLKWRLLGWFEFPKGIG